MRAGLSIVNDSGWGAGPDKRIVTCSCCPGSGLHVDGFELRCVGSAYRLARECSEYTQNHEPRGRLQDPDKRAVKLHS